MRMTRFVLASLFMTLCSGAVYSAPIVQEYSFVYTAIPSTEIPYSITGDFGVASNGSIESASGSVDGTPFTLFGGSYNFDFLDLTFYYDNKAAIGDLDGISGGIASASLRSGPASTGSLTINAVPIPSSAPMFGAALLALATVGHGLRRKSKAAAV